jgi:hypothetical protein
MGGQPHASAALPPGKTRYPLYRRLGGPQSRSVQVRKISPPPGFDSRTVQPATPSTLSLHYWVTCGQSRDTIPELHPSIDQTLSSETLLHIFRAIYMYKAVYVQLNALVPLLHVPAICCGHLQGVHMALVWHVLPEEGRTMSETCRGYRYSWTIAKIWK